MSDNTPILVVRNLEVTYSGDSGDVKAVRSLSIDLQGPSEVLGVIGESGSGKTTLGRSVVRGLLGNPRVSGEVFFEGVDLLAMSGDQHRDEIAWRMIAFVPQDPNETFSPVRRVGAQIAEEIRIKGDNTVARARGLRAWRDRRDHARTKTLELFDAVGLPRAFFERYTHQLSGGERQRASIAMALSLDPKLIVLDEPTSALDVIRQREVISLLDDLKEERGISYLFITHDTALAASFCDRIAVIYKGLLLEHGPVRSVINNPLHPYTKMLIASTPTLSGKRLERIPIQSVDLRTLDDSCPFAGQDAFCSSERCSSESMPPLREITPGSGHFVACYGAIGHES